MIRFTNFFKSGMTFSPNQEFHLFLYAIGVVIAPIFLSLKITALLIKNFNLITILEFAL